MRTAIIASLIAIASAVAANVTGVKIASAQDYLFCTTTDFITGSSSEVLLSPGHATQQNVASVHSDAMCRYFDGLIYVINRAGGDNIQILDPNNNYNVVRQFLVGGPTESTDPHDILVLSPTKAYVTRYNMTSLWIVDPSTGLKTGEIDFSSFNDVDGIPEMDTMARVGNLVFVTVQRLDRSIFAPGGPSYVAVIDITTDTIVDVDAVAPGVQSILLAGANPFSEIRLDPYTGKLYVSCTGFFGVVDDGVERIDPVGLVSEGIIYTEAAAGGDINDVQIVSATKGYVIVADASFNTILATFDPASGANTGTLFSPTDFVLNDVERGPDGRIYVADRTAVNPGIRIWNAETDVQETVNPINVGLPPFDICFNLPVQTGIGDAPEIAVSALGAAYPNPFNPVTTIPFSIVRGGQVSLVVYSPLGGLVRTLVDGPRAPGAYRVTWDGRNDDGKSVATGVYFIRLRSADGRATRKVQLLK